MQTTHSQFASWLARHQEPSSDTWRVYNATRGIPATYYHLDVSRLRLKGNLPAVVLQFDKHVQQASHGSVSFIDNVLAIVRECFEPDECETMDDLHKEILAVIEHDDTIWFEKTIKKMS